MKRYREKSEEIMIIFNDFSPDVMQLSIDEAFLDITGTEGLFGPPEILAKKLKEAVRSRTGLTVSVGLASNKYIAKIASGMSKPDGLYCIPPGDEEKFMGSLPVDKIWGAGKKTQELFRKHGLKSCADIHRLSHQTLVSIFGNSFGEFLYRAVRGEPAEAFDRERGNRSMSAERTFPYDLVDEFDVETALLDICETHIFRLLNVQQEEHESQSRTVLLKIRYEDFSTETAQATFPHAIRTLNELYDHVLALFHKKYQTGRGVRLIGAGLMNIEEGGAAQADLFDIGDEKEQHLEKTILEINKKFPAAALRRGRSWLANHSDEE
jgi:DNA polymerase-4